MTEEQKPTTGGMPPKLNLTPPQPPAPPAAAQGEDAPATQVVSPAPKKQTTRIDLTAVTGAPTPPKKQTSRLTMVPADAGQATAKTIRLAPAPAKPAALPTLPPPVPAPAPPPLTGRLVPPEEAAKSKTSRIPLEAAVGPEQAAGEQAGVPKTIRIKRPGSAATWKVPKAPGPEEEAPAAPAEAAKSKTAQIDVSGIAPEAPGQATQRKTIKIRRPDGTTGPTRPAGRTLQVARLEPELEEELAGEVEGPGIVYSIVAIAAVCVAAFVVYVIVAQFNPGMSATLPGAIRL
jgi:hypothetical protein